jgi:dihydrolipoamide dehydrogenase
VIPSVAYTDPEVARMGVTKNEVKAASVKYRKGVFPWVASCRSLTLGRDEGITKVLFDESIDRDHRVRHCRPECRGPHRRGRARHRDGFRRRADHPPASHTLGMGTITDLYLPNKEEEKAK